METVDTKTYLFTLLVTVSLLYHTQAAAIGKVRVTEKQLDPDSDLKQLAQQKFPTEVDLDLHKEDDETASEDLDALADRHHYEENDNDEEDDDFEEDDYEAEDSLMAENIYSKTAAVLDDESEIARSSVTWRTPNTPSYSDEELDEDISPLEKRARFETESTELKQGYRQGDLDLEREMEVKDRPGAPEFPTIRVIELNETLYLNDTDDKQAAFQPAIMPDTFEDYDVNRDGWISLPELRFVTGASEGATEAFNAADIDGDGRVDRKEFDTAMWGAQVDQPPPQGLVLMPAEDLQPSSIPRSVDGPKAP